MLNKTKFINKIKPKKVKIHGKVVKRLVINPKDTLIGLKGGLKLVKDISVSGGTILLVGNGRKYKYLMESYAREVKQPFMYRRWVHGLLSNDTLLKDHLLRYGSKIDRAHMSDWLRRNKVTDFLIRYEGYLNNLNQPSLVIFLNTSQLSDALDEVNSLNIPSLGLATTSMDRSKLTYPIPSNDQSLKTSALFVELVKEAIKEGVKQRKTVLKHMAKKVNKTNKK